jgi:hypothetical protein
LSRSYSSPVASYSCLWLMNACLSFSRTLFADNGSTTFRAHLVTPCDRRSSPASRYASRMPFAPKKCRSRRNE